MPQKATVTAPQSTLNAETSTPFAGDKDAPFGIAALRDEATLRDVELTAKLSNLSVVEVMVARTLCLPLASFIKAKKDPLHAHTEKEREQLVTLHMMEGASVTTASPQASPDPEPIPYCVLADDYSCAKIEGERLEMDDLRVRVIVQELKKSPTHTITNKTAEEIVKALELKAKKKSGALTSSNISDADKTRRTALHAALKKHLSGKAKLSASELTEAEAELKKINQRIKDEEPDEDEEPTPEPTGKGKKKTKSETKWKAKREVFEVRVGTNRKRVPHSLVGKLITFGDKGNVIIGHFDCAPSTTKKNG